MSALRDHKAEVLGALDRFASPLWSVEPAFAGRRQQIHSHRFGRHLKAPIGVGPRPGDKSELGDALQPIGRRPDYADRICDVLAKPTVP